MSAGPPRSVSPSGEVVDMSGAASFAKNGAALPSSSDENGECSPSEEAGFTTSSPAEVTLPPSCSLPSSSSVPAAHESSGVPMASTVGQKCHDSPIASPPPPPVAAGDEPVASSCVSTHDRTCSSLSSAPSSSNSDEEEDEEGDKGICPAGGTHRRQHPTTPPPPPLPPRQQHSEQPSERVSEYTSGDHHRSEVANPPSDTAPPCPQGHRHHHHHHHHRHHTASSQRSTSVLSGGAGSVDSLETMTLSEAMRPQMPPLSIEEVQRFARHLVLGLHFLHRHHYAHLDVKTANVLITASEECRLADLGCAMRLQPPPSPEDREAEGGAADSPAAAPYPVLLNHEEITELRGTALYMAPEMIRFERHCIGSPGDIWSLGCVLMEMATGCAPWRHIARDKLRVLFRIGSARTELPLPPLMRAWSEEAREWLAEAELLETEETGSTATYDDDDDGDNHHPHGVRVEEGPHAGEGKDEGEIYEDCNGNASHQPRHSAFGNAEADEDSGGHPDEPPRRERRLELCASPQRRSTSPLHSYHTSRAPKTAATAGASVPCGTIPITPGGASASFIANHADWLNATMACPPSSLSAAGATSYNGAVGTATSASAIAPVPAAWSRCCETAGGAQTPNHATASSTKEADQANVGNEESEAALPSTACRHARDEESDAPAATIDVPVAASPVHEEGRPGEEETAAAGGGGDNVDEMDDNGDGELDQYTSVARYVAHQRRLMELYVQLEDFVGCCLRIRPEERSTAEQLLNHPFLTL